jgi:nucleotide-binding universal stress UspA family protein
MNILYATDGSQGALCAGRLLAGLPHRRDVHVHIVTVLAKLDSIHDAARDTAEGTDILAAARRALGGFPGHVTTSMTRADSTSETVETILFSAVYAKADVIVLGASGHSSIARFLIGNVSEAVVRHADIPVLIARPMREPLRDVVVGIDGSDPARCAAHWAAECLPLPGDCAFHLLHCVHPPVWNCRTTAAGTGLSELGTEGALEDAIRDGVISAASSLEPLAKEIAVISGRRITTGVTAGYPARELVSSARERGAGLLVVGSHGLSNIERFFIGSVSENVLRHAGCSVLVARTPLCLDRAVPVTAGKEPF